jgi:hypothetical protein
MKQQQVIVNVQYTEKEFVRGMSFVRRSMKMPILWIIVPIILMLAGYILFFKFFLAPDGPWTSGDIFKFGLGIALVPVVAYFLKDRQFFTDLGFSGIYERSPLLQEEYRIAFEEEGIHSSSRSISNELAWDAIQRAVETEDDFHFYISPDQSFFVPKRVFSDAQTQQLKVLAQRVMPDRCELLN